MKMNGGALTVVPESNGTASSVGTRGYAFSTGNGPGEIEAIIEQYKASGSSVRWPIPVELESAPEVVYRNDFVRKLVGRSVPEILAAYVYFSVSDMKRLLGLARRYLLPRELEGVGLDLGSGSGLLASVVATRPKVKAILAIEVCEEAAKLLIPRVSSWVLQDKYHKVVPVLGTFDNLQLPDNSVDFAVEIDSFHHADDLAVILGECARVLKPGGMLLAFDRCWPNEHPDWDLERLLAVVYSPEFLAANGYPPDITLTRRENGEHEYKLFQWQAGFAAAGLTLERMCKFSQEINYRQAVKGALSILPRKLTRMLYSTDTATPETARQWGAQQLKSLGRQITSGREIALPERWPQRNVFSPRETTAFLLSKEK